MTDNIYTENGIVKDFGSKGIQIIINTDNLQPLKIKHIHYIVSPGGYDFDKRKFSKLSELVEVTYPHPDPECTKYGACYTRLEIHDIHQAVNEIEDSALKIGSNTEDALGLIAGCFTEKSA